MSALHRLSLVWIATLALACGDNAKAPTPENPDGAPLPPPVMNECGDLVVAGDEECDDGNTDDTDACLSDCTLACGNGIVSGSEVCDTGIPAGGEGACPSACDDFDPCTADTLSGEACLAQCSSVAITAPAPDDGCCPPGADSATDSDCMATCGNSMVEPGEQCDDGGLDPGDGCDASCAIEPVLSAFRISSLSIRDPHAFVPVFTLCSDLTQQLNAQLNTALSSDEDGDGLLDLSLALVFRAFNQAEPMTPLETLFAECTAPVNTTRCQPPADPNVTAAPANNRATGICLTPEAGSTRPYNPPVLDSTAPCFASETVPSLTLDFTGLTITLVNAQVSGSYVGSPATGMTSGMIKGFLTEAQADMTMLPADLPVVGGRPLSSILPGGRQSCRNQPAQDDRDIGPNGESGWWMYINFEASQVDWMDP